MKIRALPAGGLFLCAPPALTQTDRVNGRAFATRSPVLGRHGMVCTSLPLASQIGLDLLKAGRIGGAPFAIAGDAKSKKLHRLHTCGRSPLDLSLAQLKTELAQPAPPDRLPPRGFLPLSVPDCVDRRDQLHQKSGKLPLRSVLAPALRYAKQGFPVTYAIAYGWAIGVRHARLDQFPCAFLDTFVPGGHAPTEGQIFKNPALARTLSLIGRHGRDAFSRGEIAVKIDAFLHANGGVRRPAGLEKHASTWVDPVAVN